MLETKYPGISVTKKTKEHKYCIVYITMKNAGMFANFYRLLYGIYICTMEEIVPIIFFGQSKTFPEYRQKEEKNWFDLYFKKRHRPPKELNVLDLRVMYVSFPSVAFVWDRISQREKNLAHLFIVEYFRPRKSFDKAVKDFVTENFASNRVLGVHYRGRDKVTERPIPSFKDYEARIDYFLNNKMCDKIFFCTDELHLRKWAKKKYDTKVIIYDLKGDYSSHVDNEDMLKQGLHVDHLNPSLVWDDTMMECYLLSKCDILMGSSHSSFTLFSTFINPSLPHVVLNS